jgi:porphobilinogen synthase
MSLQDWSLQFLAPFPMRRPRRLRRTPAIRAGVREVAVTLDDLVVPMFVREGISEPVEIPSLPGVSQHTLDSLIKEVERLLELGLHWFLLFGVPQSKDAQGSGAYDDKGIVQVACRALKDRFGSDMVLVCDLCLDEYTDTGHCGVLDSVGDVDNDATLKLYQRAAVAQAAAGADVVAPSGMMDGQVGAIRQALDEAGFKERAILAYSAKFASGLYGPFRDAVDVEIVGGGNRRSYQQDPANKREALLEVAMDLAEGADMVMVKPAIAYLDVLSAVAEISPVPVAAYQVSGEYSMVHAAAERGWIELEAVALEHLSAIKRAGADLIITYFAPWFAALKSQQRSSGG